MERKLGEIFEFNGEYYQVCLDKYKTCNGCSLFQNSMCSKRGWENIVGSCTDDIRSDNNDVHFKKVSLPSIEPSLVSINFEKKKLLLIL